MSKNGILEIQDEVNVRFLGVPKNVIARAQEELTYWVPGHQHMPAYKMGRWDGKIRLMSKTGKTYLNLVEKVLGIFESEGYDFEIDDFRDDWSEVVDQLELPSDDIFSDYTWPDGTPIMLRDYQLEAVHTAITEGQGLLEMATGAGKAQPLTSTVMTPSGPRMMGDMRIGDVVSTIDGNTTTVTGVFPQGVKTKYEMVFQDGRVVECCDEHLWWVYDKRIKRHAGKIGMDRFEVMPAKTIKKILDGNSATSLQIPLTPTYHDKRELPVEPYLLGALLGDGGLSQTSYSFTSMDDDIRNRVMNETSGDGDVWRDASSQNSGAATTMILMNDTVGTKRPHLKTAITSLGLDKTHSDTKFIPKDYLLSSIEDRYELLQGLMDTDGYVSPKSNMSYSTASLRLAEDVQALVRSLGGIAHITSKPGSYIRNGLRVSCKECYTVNLQLLDPTKAVWCERKSIRARKTQYSDGLSLRIVEVREVGVAEMQCISVADPTRIYITDHYTVTHNTLTCAALSKVYSKHGKVIVIVPNIDLVIQTQALFKRVGLDTGIWYGEMKDAKDITISTWQSLDHCPELFAGVVCTIVDEVHQAKAKTLSEILTGPAARCPFRFGCTGTVPKEEVNFQQIRGIIGDVIFQLRAWELQERDVLASSEIFQIEMVDSKNPKYINAPAFEEWTEQLDWLFGDPDRMKAIANLLSDAAMVEGNLLSLIPFKKHGKALQELLPDSVSLDGDIKGTKRQEFYAEFNKGDNNVLICTFGIASTGLDIPRIMVLCFIEPGKKFEKVIQTIGRGLRKASDKDHIIIMDICSDTDYSKKHAAERRRLYKEARIVCHREKLDYANFG